MAYSVFDVAAYILRKTGRVTAMKLQKLVYYSQAWSLVWDERPLVKSRIEAWAGGPVATDLYAFHRGQFEVSESSMIDSHPERLDKLAVETIDAVLAHYAKFSARQLSELTHSEQPWIDARKGLSDGQRGENEITHAAMDLYYSGLF